jgi:5-methylcytosine-specific restriction endonuclease McrBC regulatory subunit McrC
MRKWNGNGEVRTAFQKRANTLLLPEECFEMYPSLYLRQGRKKYITNVPEIGV